MNLAQSQPQQQEYDLPSIASVSQTELDRLIRNLASDVAGCSPLPFGEETMRPRWISAAELVRRVRPFLSNN